MMTFHKLLVIASAIKCYVHKIPRTVRGAENPMGPDFTLLANKTTEIQIKKNLDYQDWVKNVLSFGK